MGEIEGWQETSLPLELSFAAAQWLRSVREQCPKASRSRKQSMAIKRTAWSDILKRQVTCNNRKVFFHREC